MLSGSAVDRPTTAHRRAIRRRRSWAGLAVIVCLAADLWSVSGAGAQEPIGPGSLVQASRVSVSAGTGPKVPLDGVESVPEAASDSAIDGGSPRSGTGATAQKGDGTGDGKDAKGAVIESGSGRFGVVAMPASTERPTPTTGRTVHYTVELEDGIDIRGEDLATLVGKVLTDPRGWQGTDGVRFVNVSPAAAAKGAPVDLHITLASPATTDRLCAPLETHGQVSCHNAGRILLNLRRWVLGAKAYGNDITGYRTYLVNHEVGHGIGHAHAYCGGAGKVAPVMMQQTYGLKGCTPWPWPSPRRA